MTLNNKESVTGEAKPLASCNYSVVHCFDGASSTSVSNISYGIFRRVMSWNATPVWCDSVTTSLLLLD